MGIAAYRHLDAIRTNQCFISKEVAIMLYVLGSQGCSNIFMGGNEACLLYSSVPSILPGQPSTAGTQDTDRVYSGFVSATVVAASAVMHCM